MNQNTLYLLPTIRSSGFTVKPLSKSTIQKVAKFVRKIAENSPHNIIKNYKMDITKFIECSDLVSSLEVVEDKELPNAFAQTFSSGTIKIRESIYNKATNNDGHARFTIAHELGHLLLHKDQIALSRPFSDTQKIYCNSEWQADEFAGNLLAPNEYLESHRYDSDAKIAQDLGVSVSCVRTRRAKLNI